VVIISITYLARCRAADKSLAPIRQKKKELKGRHFSFDAEVIGAKETRLDGQPSEFF
jgi:hypothetical protein